MPIIKKAHGADSATVRLDLSQEAEPLYSQIVGHIRNWIRSGRFREGDALPSERELAATFNVSRVPVREALKILEFLGVVHYVRGRGVRVKKMRISDLLGNLEFPAWMSTMSSATFSRADRCSRQKRRGWPQIE